MADNKKADNKKQNVSVRMNAADLKKIREVADRLQVRESDVFRFAIKNTLAKLTPLYDKEVKGSDLVPVFMEFGKELTNYFDLDSSRLEEIINDGVESPMRRVDKEDIELLAMSGTQENYAFIKLKDLSGQVNESQGLSSLLKQYLSDKYIRGMAGQVS